MDNINQLKKTIAELSTNPAEAETVKALKKQLTHMIGCIHGTKRPCRKCGGKIIIECSNSKVEKQTVSPGYCASCPHFTTGSAGLQSGMSATLTLKTDTEK